MARPQAFCCLYSIVLEKPPFGILVKIFKMLVFFMWLSLTGDPLPSSRPATAAASPRLRARSLSLSPRRRVLADRCPHLAHRGHVQRGKCAIAPAHIAGTPSSAPRETLAHAPSTPPAGNGFFALYFGLFASLRLSMSLLDKPDTEPVKTYEEA